MKRNLLQSSLLIQRLDAPLRDLRHQAAQRWAGLSAIGQRTITICAGLLVLGLSWALVYEPLQSSLIKNRLRIEALGVQATQMRAQAATVQSIRSMAPVAASATQTIADVAGLQGVFGSKAVVTIAIPSTPSTAAGVATFRVTVDQMPYSVLVDRLEQATGRYRVRVFSMSLTRGSATNATVAAPATAATTAATSPVTSTLVSGEIALVDSK
ncbi:MAG: type II secretion system protein M [Aeromicrobium sp.]|nr:type II secretion system protein M [Burkholderiales bacterium]